MISLRVVRSFKNGTKIVEDMPWSGLALISSDGKNVLVNYKSSFTEVTDELDFSRVSVSSTTMPQFLWKCLLVLILMSHL